MSQISHLLIYLVCSSYDSTDDHLLNIPSFAGLIASVSSGKGHSSDIGLVESLVTRYIQNPSCIILLTVACESEFSYY